jgi:hypothetical protein
MELLTPNELANNYAMLNNKQALRLIDTNNQTTKLAFVDLKEIENLCIIETPMEVAVNYAKLNNKQFAEIKDYTGQIIGYSFFDLTTIENLCNDINAISKLHIYTETRLLVICKNNNIYLIFSNEQDIVYLSILITNIDQSILQTNDKEEDFKLLINTQML